MNQERVLPDFLIIPYQVIVDPKLQPTDRLLYGLIYWYEHMKLEKCVASNKTLSELLSVDITSIEKGLQRLEEQQCILRFYKDDSKKHRTYIEALVKFNRTNGGSRPAKNRVTDPTNGGHIYKRYKENLYDSNKEKPKKDYLPTLEQRYGKT
jgi:hypothetical protein